MLVKKMKTKLFFLLLFLILADQIFKHFSNITSCNSNLAWSLPVAPAVFYSAWIVIIVTFIFIFLRTKNYSQKIFLIFILAGAISNIIDRLRFGCVVDFIDLKLWPAFNLGDVYITVGVIFLIILNLKFQMF